MDEAFVNLEEVREEDSGSENEDEEDHECEVEDDEEERFEIFEPTTAMAADWLENQPEAQEAQDILRDSKQYKILRPGTSLLMINLVARQEGLLHLGLKCPGPGLVSEGLVQGAQRCAKNAVISFETGVFYRHNFNQHIGIRSRCKFCHGGFMFNQYLRQYILEAGSGQTTCSSQNCFDPIWQSSKFCKKHFLAWSPDRPGEDINAVNELRSLFQKAASEQWSPKTAEMAGLLRRAEAHAKTNVPASDIVNLDIEFTFSSQEVLQIGLADLKGAKALDCLTEHSEGIVAPSSSRHPVPLTFRQKRHRDKVRSHFVQDGTLNANSVVKKLQEAGISTDTTFLAWATWCFDLKYLRNWLQQEGFHNVLPEEKELCLVLNEFRDNLNAIIGYKCYRGGVFPLRLSLVFPLLFGKDHPLAGRNHHALVDAQQLSLMTRLFIDLCKPPDEREFWQGSGVTKLGSWKVQQKLEAFYSPSTDKELESARGEQELEELSSPPEMEKQGPGKEPEQAEPFSPTESRKLESKKRQRRRKGTSAPRRPTKRPRAR